LFGAVLATGPPIDFTKDTLDHIAYVDEVAATGEWFPTTAFYPSPGSDGADLRKALLHGVYGLFAASSGLGAGALFALLAPVMLVLLGACVYAASRDLLGGRAAAAVAALLFLLCWDGGPRDAGIRAAFYPNRFGEAALLLFTAEAVAHLRGRRRRLGTAAAYGFIAAAIHIQYALLVACVVGVAALWKTCVVDAPWRAHLRRALPLGGAAFVAVVPFGLYRYLTAYQTNPLHTQVQGVTFVWGDWFVADLARTAQWGGLLGLSALLAMVALWRERRASAGVGFAIASLATVLLLYANPVVLALLYGALSYLVFRIDRIAPLFLLPAALTSGRRGLFVRRRWAAAAAGLAVAGAVVGAAGLFWGGAFSPAAVARGRALSHWPWRAGLSVLADSLPAGAVIASDPVTSYTVTAFTPHRVVCTLDQHAPPNDRRVGERVAAARDIVSPYTAPREKIDLMARFGATHVLLNPRLPAGQRLDYWTLDPSLAAAAERALDACGGALEKRTLPDGLVLYARTGEPAPPGAGDGYTGLVGALPPGVTAVGASAGTARLAGAAVGEAEIERGGALAMETFWSPGEPVGPGTYVVTVRFDHAELALPLGGRPFPKLARKLKEAIEGRRYRFRADHMVAHGFFGPDAWPAGAIVRDSVVVRVPRYMAAGRYTVRVKMITVANAPNQRLRDYFFDDDVYEGVPVGEITIR
ncbi:MAG: hypothetical protein OEO21_08440, partial [Candidatus Krumholzibacteria bacterium]|nr:hypothetical protein [Candidatus Krumholzibacteria bacterium]